MSYPKNPGFMSNDNYFQKPIKEIKPYKDYRLFVIKDGKEKQELVFGDISWRDNMETLGMELHFDFPRNIDDKHMKKYDDIHVGDKVLFTNLDKEIFRGMITTIDYSRYTKSITAHDYAFYLNKSKVIIQFNKMTASAAIKKLCSENNVPVGKIDNMSVKITEIYKNQSVSEIIKDIIEKQKEHNGGEYRMEMREGKLFVVKANNMKIKPLFKPARNISIHELDVGIGDISRTETVDGMMTKVVVVSEEKKKVKTLATEIDNKNLKKYGLFQEIITVNKDEAKNAKRIAKNTLNENKGVQNTISISMLGDDKVRSGRVIVFKNETFGLDGDYLITDCNHTYKNNNRWMDLEVKKVTQ